MRSERDRTVGVVLFGLKTRRLWRLAGIVASCLLAASLGIDPAGAVEPAPSSLMLFDGKTLEGWKPSFERGGEIKVVDGAIQMPVGKPISGITSTRKDLPRTNYELTYEAQRLEGGDFFAAATFPVGKAHITLVNGGWGGNVTGLSSIDGSDASENETNTYFKFKNKVWYKFRVRVTDNTIRGWLDDKEIVAVNYTDRTVDTRIETYANQPLGFAAWESSGAVRAITVRGLTAEEVAATTKKAD